MNAIVIQCNDKRWRGHTTTVRKAARGGLNAQVPSFQRKLESSKKKISRRYGSALDSSFRWNDDVSLTILLTSDAEVQALNKQYRGKDKPTNVLSFPDGDRGEDGALQLGDIALAYETVMREAEAQEKTFAAHLAHLVIHGVLHLLGYDHEEEDEAEAMEALEIALLATMGIANPYK